MISILLFFSDRPCCRRAVSDATTTQIQKIVVTKNQYNNSPTDKDVKAVLRSDVDKNADRESVNLVASNLDLCLNSISRTTRDTFALFMAGLAEPTNDAVPTLSSAVVVVSLAMECVKEIQVLQGRLPPPISSDIHDNAKREVQSRSQFLRMYDMFSSLLDAESFDDAEPDPATLEKLSALQVEYGQFVGSAAEEEVTKSIKNNELVHDHYTEIMQNIKNALQASAAPKHDEHFQEFLGGLLSKHMSKLPGAKKELIPSGATSEQLTAWASRDSPEGGSALATALILGKTSIALQIDVLSRLDRLQISVAAYKATILEDPVSDTLPSRSKMFDEAVHKFTSAATAAAADVGNTDWLKAYNVKPMLDHARRIKTELVTMLIDLWRQKAHNMSKNTSKVIPMGWKYFAVQKPDKAMIMEHILAPGTATRFSEHFAECAQLHKAFLSLDPLTENKFLALCKTELDDLGTSAEVLEILVSIAYVYKYIYIKFPQLNTEQCKQALRDVRKKVKGKRVPAEVMALLSAAAK